MTYDDKTKDLEHQVCRVTLNIYFTYYFIILLPVDIDGYLFHDFK